MLGSLKKPSGNDNRLGNPISSAPSAVPIGKVMTQQALDISAQSGKRPFEDEEYEIFKQNKRNKQFANGDKTTNDQLTPNEMCDTLVCGHCRFVTSDFEEFKEHRISGCDKFKDPEEPHHRLKCATCSQRFLGAWGLLEHLTEFHRMLLYNEEKITPEDRAQIRAASVSNQVIISEAPISYLNASDPSSSQTDNSTPACQATEGTPLSSSNGTPLI